VAVAENQSVVERRVHAMVRYAGVAAVLVLVLRRLIYLRFPSLLPSKAWHPDSTFLKWTGIATNTAFELVIQLTLLGAPIGILIAYRARTGRSSKKPMLVSVAVLMLMYGVAWLLLSPPKPN